MKLLYKFAVCMLILGIGLIGTENEYLRAFAYAAAASFLAVHVAVMALSREGIGISKTAVIGLVFVVYLVLRAQSLDGLLAAAYAGILAGLATLTNPRGLRMAQLEFPFHFSYGIALAVGVVAYAMPGLFINPNYVTAVVAFLALPLILRRKSWLLALPIIFFVFMFGARSVLVGILAAIGLYWVAKRFTGKAALVGFSIGVIVSIAGLVFLWDYFLANSTFLDDESIRLTGKRIQSGRTELWLDIFADMDDRDWFFGTGYSYARLYSSLQLSEHSSYVYTIYRYGLVGLGLLFAVLIAILARLWKNGAYVAFIAAFAFMIRDFFELTMVANNVAIAIYFWLLCCTGIFDTSELRLPWRAKRTPVLRHSHA